MLDAQMTKNQGGFKPKNLALASMVAVASCHHENIHTALKFKLTKAVLDTRANFLSSKTPDFEFCFLKVRFRAL